MIYPNCHPDRSAIHTLIVTFGGNSNIIITQTFRNRLVRQGIGHTTYPSDRSTLWDILGRHVSTNKRGVAFMCVVEHNAPLRDTLRPSYMRRHCFAVCDANVEHTALTSHASLEKQFH